MRAAALAYDEIVRGMRERDGERRLARDEHEMQSGE